MSIIKPSDGKFIPSALTSYFLFELNDVSGKVKFAGIISKSINSEGLLLKLRFIVNNSFTDDSTIVKINWIKWNESHFCESFHTEIGRASCRERV